MVMATAELYGLLRQAVSSTEDGNFYLCAACIALRQENSVERARKSLLASVLQLLERQSAASSLCTCEICGVGGGSGREGEGARGRRDDVWQLCCEALKFGEGNSKTLLSFVCDCHHFQECCCQLVLAALAVGCSHDFLREGENLSHFLTHVYMQFWSPQIERFSKQVNSISTSTEKNEPSTIDGWSDCIKNVALLHVLQQMHSLLESKLEQYTCTDSTCQTGLSSETGTSRTSTIVTCRQFMCEETSKPLTVRLAHAHILHSMYLKWWRNDEDDLKNRKEIPAVNRERVGLVLKVGILV